MAETKPTWMKMKTSEIETIIVDLAKKGETPAKIGLVLRDQHGVPKAKLVGKRITQIIKEHKIPLQIEKNKTTQNIEKLRLHQSKNKNDHHAKRAMTKQLWALHKLETQNH